MKDCLHRLERILLAEQASLRRNVRLLEDEIEENKKALNIIEELKVKLIKVI